MLLLVVVGGGSRRGNREVVGSWGSVGFSGGDKERGGRITIGKS